MDEASAADVNISASAKTMSEKLNHLLLKFEDLQKAMNESDARLRNMSMQNAKLKEEVDVLKKEHGGLRQNQSALHQEKQNLKKGQDQLAHNQRVQHRSILYEVTQAKLTLTKLEARFNVSESQRLSTNSSSLQQVRI